jgi:hypothetical protein
MLDLDYGEGNMAKFTLRRKERKGELSAVLKWPVKNSTTDPPTDNLPSYKLVFHTLSSVEFLLELTDEGTVEWCNDASNFLLGYFPYELYKRPISYILNLSMIEGDANYYEHYIVENPLVPFKPKTASKKDRKLPQGYIVKRKNALSDAINKVEVVNIMGHKAG